MKILHLIVPKATVKNIVFCFLKKNYLWQMYEVIGTRGRLDLKVSGVAHTPTHISALLMRTVK